MYLLQIRDTTNGDTVFETEQPEEARLFLASRNPSFYEIFFLDVITKMRVKRVLSARKFLNGGSQRRGVKL